MGGGGVGAGGGGWGGFGVGGGGRTTFLRFSDAMFVQHSYPIPTSSVTVHETGHLHLSVSFDKLVLYALARNVPPHRQAERVCTH